MTKKRLVQKKEEHSNPYKSERIDTEDGCICIKYPIRLTKDRLLLLDKICDILEQPTRLYLAQALYEKIDSDLHCPQEIGQAICNGLLKEWNVYKDEVNDYRIFQYSTQK